MSTAGKLSNKVLIDVPVLCPLHEYELAVRVDTYTCRYGAFINTGIVIVMFLLSLLSLFFILLFLLFLRLYCQTRFIL